MRTCRTCDTDKPLVEFTRSSACRSGYLFRCKSCTAAAARARYIVMGGRAAQRAAQLKRDYGLAPEDFDEILKSQDGVCALCDAPPSRGDMGTLHVDHDHTTGEIRGLLCGRCNRALGLLQDKPELLREAIRYLETA